MNAFKRVDAPTPPRISASYQTSNITLLLPEYHAPVASIPCCHGFSEMQLLPQHYTATAGLSTITNPTAHPACTMLPITSGCSHMRLRPHLRKTPLGNATLSRSNASFPPPERILSLPSSTTSYDEHATLRTAHYGRLLIPPTPSQGSQCRHYSLHGASEAFVVRFPKQFGLAGRPSCYKYLAPAHFFLFFFLRRQPFD